MLRVALALPWLEPGRAGGGEVATRALLLGLDRGDLGGAEVTVLGAPRNAEWLRSLALKQTEVRVLTGTWDNRRLRGALLAAHSLVRGRASRFLERDFDLVHSPLLPTVPVKDTRHVATLWDVNHRDSLRGDYSYAVRAYRALTYDRAAARSTRVFTSSHFSAARIQRVLGLPAERIEVVTPGVLEDHADAPLGIDVPDLAPLGVREPFAYYPAAWWPHKNHEGLMAAIARLPETLDMQLVLSGGPANAPSRARTLALRHGIQTRTIHVGYVPQRTVRALYANASLVVYPSLYEGFGIPPLEAMWCRTPVVASDLPPIREVVGDAALLVDPGSPRALATAIKQILSDSELRESLISAGFERSRFYSQKAGAERHAAAYFRAMTG